MDMVLTSPHMDMKKPAGMLKSATSDTVKRILGAIVNSGGQNPDIEVPDAESRRFVLAFCGSGTGHMTQALTVATLLKKYGFELCGVVTDDEADEKMLDEIIRPLGVEVLVLPAITLVHREHGVVPPHKVALHVRQAQRAMPMHDHQIREFFRKSRCGLLLNFFHIMLAHYLLSRKLPESVNVVSIAAQFAIKDLPVSELPSLKMVVAKSTIDVMSQIFAARGPCIPLSAIKRAGTLAPLVEQPTPIGKSDMPRLILCYFLVQKDAVRLEQLLSKHPIEGVTFHCFSASELTPPKGRQLSIHSHVKQRKLFKELFAQCTGVIVSTGNETIWEAVCRGVPVLTIPTAGHGEQMINSVLHARNHPHLVRARHQLRIEDVRWVSNFDRDAASRTESEQLRDWAIQGGTHGLLSLLKADEHSSVEQSKEVISI